MHARAIRSDSGDLISSVDGWFLYAPPRRGTFHWKDGRSAKELAKAWFRSGSAEVPDELEALFRSQTGFAELEIESGIAEKVIRLDNFRGTHRRCDLVLNGRAGRDLVLVGIEAKADEEFGPRLGDYLRSLSGRKSNAPARIGQLSSSVFGRPAVGDAQLGGLRYQLLHGLAATAIEAKDQGASEAIFVVYEFISDAVDRERVARNSSDLDRFVQSMPGCEGAVVRNGELTGPITIPGGLFVPGNIPLWVGKVTSQC